MNPRGLLIALLIALLIWAGLACVAISLKRAAACGELPVLHLRPGEPFGGER